jgi:hypothetical protein
MGTGFSSAGWSACEVTGGPRQRVFSTRKGLKNWYVLKTAVTSVIIKIDKNQLKITLNLNFIFKKSRIDKLVDMIDLSISMTGKSILKLINQSGDNDLNLSKSVYWSVLPVLKSINHF